MTTFQLLLLVHVLFFGFWIGADIPVLYISRLTRRSDLAPATRVFLGRVLFQLDTSPTICMTLMLPVGFSLASQLGLVTLPATVLTAFWIGGLAWAALMLKMIHGGVSPLWRNIERGWRYLLIVALLWAGTSSLLQGSPFPVGWLALKLLLFAVIIVASIGIDTTIRPYIPAMMQLAESGPTPQIDAQITRAVANAQPFVYLMYATIVAEAAVGIWRGL